MKPSELKNRTRNFSVQLVRLVEKMPRTPAGNAVAEPVIKSGLAIGAKYRTICLAQNPYDFLHRIDECEDFADECLHWLDVMYESELMPQADVAPIRDEARKLRRIFTKSRKVAAKRQRSEPRLPERRSGDEDIPF